MNSKTKSLILQEQTMATIKDRRFQVFCFLLSAAVFAMCGCKTSSPNPGQAGFSSYNDASRAFITALRQDNNAELLKLFGPDARQLIWSGDQAADQQRRQEFLKAYDDQHKIERTGNRAILVVGKHQWPFPIPMVEHDGRWLFDTAAGREEILNRRIGQNELDTIETMLAVVDAQREYAQGTHLSGLREYAPKFRSDPGKKDGLYWESGPGEKPSPLGPLVAQARQEGYFTVASPDKPVPYHGYIFKMLTAQGPHARGGAYDYMVNGRMIGGFGALAYPAQYGNSGVMTFIVNHDGVVYQKDLGPDTEQRAQSIVTFDPDSTWTKVKE